ncbi:hypothetical protein KC19_VG260000 [Ceratodon purpureus]|uniref:Uncharacterized protein n=1 Tax=Ceratodon purpureus TaxID=3225 RepID=A0A8T0HTW3_CERPU|nr:hypothetical protein KC19_VG260000 [Ceratodon purpureus]
MSTSGSTIGPIETSAIMSTKEETPNEELVHPTLSGSEMSMLKSDKMRRSNANSSNSAMNATDRLAFVRLHRSTYCGSRSRDALPRFCC